MSSPSFSFRRSRSAVWVSAAVRSIDCPMMKVLGSARVGWMVSAVKNSAYGPPRSISAANYPSSLQNGRDAHAARRTNGNQPALCLALVEQFGKRRDDAGSGCGKRVTERETAPLDVEL